MTEEDKADTVVIACHLYKDVCQAFKEICRSKGKFHSEVMRDLISKYCEDNKKGEKEGETQPPFSVKY